MRPISTLLVTLAMASLAAAQLPPTVAERLEAVVVPADPEAFHGSYRMVSENVISKPNGRKRRTVDIETSVVRPLDGDERRTLVRFVEDGEDRTEKQRAKVEDRSRRDDDDGKDDELNLPVGEHADDFEFSAPRQVDGHLEVDFEPRGGAEGGSAVRGTIAWDPATEQPVWTELTSLDPPSPMQELHLRMEMSPVGELLVVHRMLTSGRAKVLLMKRQFTSDMRFLDIVPEEDRP